MVEVVDVVVRTFAAENNIFVGVVGQADTEGLAVA